MTKIDLRKTQRFEDRHNGPDQQEIKEMLEVIGAPSLDALIDETVPAGIRMQKPLNLPLPKSEFQFLKDLFLYQLLQFF